MLVAHILQLAFSVIIVHVGRVPLPPTAVFVVTWHFLTCGIDAFIIRHHTHNNIQVTGHMPPTSHIPVFWQDVIYKNYRERISTLACLWTWSSIYEYLRILIVPREKSRLDPDIGNYWKRKVQLWMHFPRKPVVPSRYPVEDALTREGD